MEEDGHGPSKVRGLFYLPTIGDQTKEAEVIASNRYGRLSLLNQILATLPSGTVVRGGLIFRDTMKGIRKYMEDYGLFETATSTISLSSECAHAWASYDYAWFARLEKVPKAEIEQYKNWRAIAFKRTREINKDKLTRKIEEAKTELREANSFMEAQERFWT